MKKFEYKIFSPKWNPRDTDEATRSKIEQQLNVLGQEGWEVISVNEDFEYLLKKEI